MRQVLLLGLLLSLGSTVAAQQAAKNKAGVDNLIKVLKTSKDAKQRAAAARDLGETALIRVSLVQPAEPALIDALKDADGEVRQAALQTLALLEPYRKNRVANLLELLKEGEDPGTRAGAITMLGQIEGGVKEAVPLLEDIQKKELAKNEDMRNGDLLNRIAQALVGIRQHLLGGYLMALKEDKDAKVRAEAAVELGKIAKGNAEQAKAAVPVLVAALEDEAVEVRRAVVGALEAAKPEPGAVMPALLLNLRNRNEDRAVRLGVLALLTAAGPAAKDTLPFLEFMHDRESKKPEKDQELLNALTKAVEAIKK